MLQSMELQRVRHDRASENSKKYFKVKIGQKNHCLILIVLGKICLREE